MSDITTTLTRKAALKKACKSLTLKQLESLARNVNALIEEHKSAEDKVKQQKLAKIKKEMEAAGIELSDLNRSLKSGSKTKVKSKGRKKSRSKVKPKYQIQDQDGTMHQWTGRGRAPKVFQEFFDQGGSKDDCLIGD